MITRQLRLIVRHKRRLRRLHAPHVIHEVHKGIAFDIEFTPRPRGQKSRDRIHVRRPNMPLIRSRMHRQPRRPGFQRQGTEKHRIGRITFTRVAQKRNFVEIHGKMSKHKTSQSK